MKTTIGISSTVVLALIIPFLRMQTFGETGDVTAPAPILVTIDGQYQLLSKLYYPGEEQPRVPRAVVVLNFMGLKCAPCRKELPQFLEVVRSAAKSGKVKEVGVPIRHFVVSTDPLSAKEALREFLIGQGVDLETELLLDPYQKAAEKFGVRGIPRTFVISPQGRIVVDIEGATEDYRAVLRKGLAVAIRDGATK